MKYISNKTKIKIDELLDLDKFVLNLVKDFGIENAVFAIIIVDDREIRDLNKNYRNIDAATDVISFALEDDTTSIIDTRVLGDIYISIDRAKAQALEYEHSLKRELSFLALHGLLHLLGFDHETAEDEEKMFALQKEVLAKDIKNLKKV